MNENPSKNENTSKVKFPRFVVTMLVEVEDNAYSDELHEKILSTYLGNCLLNPVGETVVRTIGNPTVTYVGKGDDNE